MNTPTGPPAQSETRAGGGSGAAPRQTMQAIVLGHGILRPSRASTITVGVLDFIQLMV